MFTQIISNSRFVDQIVSIQILLILYFLTAWSEIRREKITTTTTKKCATDMFYYITSNRIECLINSLREREKNSTTKNNKKFSFHIREKKKIIFGY